MKVEVEVGALEVVVKEEVEVGVVEVEVGVVEVVVVHSVKNRCVVSMSSRVLLNSLSPSSVPNSRQSCVVQAGLNLSRYCRPSH